VRSKGVFFKIVRCTCCVKQEESGINGTSKRPDPSYDLQINDARTKFSHWTCSERHRQQRKTVKNTSAARPKGVHVCGSIAINIYGCSGTCLCGNEMAFPAGFHLKTESRSFQRNLLIGEEGKN
jgi:hypothetical protein